MKELLLIIFSCLCLSLNAQENDSIHWPNAEVSKIRPGNGKKAEAGDAMEVHFLINTVTGTTVVNTYDAGVSFYWSSTVNPLTSVPQAFKLLEEGAKIKFLIPVEEFKAHCPPDLKDYDWPGEHVYAELEILRVFAELPMAYTAFMQLMEDESAEAAVRALDGWLQQKEPAYYLGESQLNWIGYALMQAEESDQAIAVFQTNLKTHPTSWNAHDSLADAYLKAGNKEMARQHLEKALQLKPDFKPSKRKLSEL